MKKIIFLLCTILVAILLPVFTNANDKLPVQHSTKYKEISTFYDGYAIASNDYKYYVIDTDNTILFDSNSPITYCGENMFSYFVSGTTYYVDISGNIIFTSELKTENYTSEYIIVHNNYYYGIIDRKGNEVYPCKCTGYLVNNDSICLLIDDIWYVYGDTLTQIDAIPVEIMESLIIAKHDEYINAYGVVDIHGNIILPIDYFQITITENYIIAQKYSESGNNTAEIYNHRGEMLHSIDCDELYTADDKIFCIIKHDKISFVDIDGNTYFEKTLLVPQDILKISEEIPVKDITPIYQNSAVVKSKENYYYYIDMYGERQSQNNYLNATNLVNGYAIVEKYLYDQKTNKYEKVFVIIDKNFNDIMVIDGTPIWDFYEFNEGVIRYRNSDEKISFIVLPEYTDIRKYVITYNNNDGDGYFPDITLMQNSILILPDNPFNRFGYTFSHWTDGTANYNPGDTFIMPDHGVTMTAVWVKDESNFTVTLDSQHARQGDTVILTVSIQDNPDMISGELTMNYDSDKFTFQSANGVEILKNAYIHTEIVSTDNISVEWNSSGQVCEGDGDILSLKFKVNEDIPDGAYKFTVCSPVLYTSENEKLHADDASGNLIVHDGIIGDVNKDKKTDDTDLTLLKQYFAGWVNAAESIIDKFAADINMDGQLTRIDLMILARCLALWEGYHFGIPIIIQ